MFNKLKSVAGRVWGTVWIRNLINYGLPVLLCLIAFVEYTHFRPINVAAIDMYNNEDFLARIVKAEERIADNLSFIRELTYKKDVERRIREREKIIEDGYSELQKKFDKMQESISSPSHASDDHKMPDYGHTGPMLDSLLRRE